MTPHATHPGLYDETCPDCAGYPAEPRDRIGPFLQFVIVLAVIVAVAVIVRLAVSR